MAFPSKGAKEKEVESTMFKSNKELDSALEAQEGYAYSELLSELAEKGPIFGTDDQNETVIIDF